MHGMPKGMMYFLLSPGVQALDIKLSPFVGDLDSFCMACFCGVCVFIHLKGKADEELHISPKGMIAF